MNPMERNELGHHHLDLEARLGRPQRYEEPELPVSQVSKPDLNRLMSMGKKALAREVFRLQDLMEGIKEASGRGEFVRPQHQSAEAFAVMQYYAEDGSKVTVWNGRDGVTPFSFSLGGKKFSHELRHMMGPVYQQPADCGYRWETLSPTQSEAFWQRHLGRMKQQELDRAELEGRPVNGEFIQRLAKATPPPLYQGFDMGLRNLTTGELEG